MISKFNNKKGSYLDIFFIVVAMFALSIVIVVGWLALSNVNTEFQTKLSHTEATTIIQDNTDRYVNLFDGIFLFVFFGSFLATIIGSLFLDTHPAFFAISLILLVVVCVVCAVFSNAFAELETDAEMNTFTSAFTYIPFIMQYFVQIVIFMTCAVAIALFGKSRLG